MRNEAIEVTSRISEQIENNNQLCHELGQKLREFDPAFVVTVGRGTSDHAGVFAKYLIEIELGIQVSSSAPSVSSVYQKEVKFDKALVIIISQSGRSPDIINQVKMAKAAGSFCIALINDVTSPIADMVDAVLPIRAGKENAVAATKSYILTLTALLQLVANWGRNRELEEALNGLSRYMNNAVSSKAYLNPSDFENINNCIVIGRGFGYAISCEIALKLKEVCGIHAEAFSSAEFLHGPVTLAEKKILLVNVSVQDESQEVHNELIDDITNRGAVVLDAYTPEADIHPRVAVLPILLRFYLDVEKIAISRGVNPDSPPGLNKVTKTI